MTQMEMELVYRTNCRTAYIFRNTAESGSPEKWTADIEIETNRR